MSQDLITDAELAAYGIAQAVLDRLTVAQKAAVISASSATVQGLLAARYPTPWGSWDGLVKHWTARLAVRAILAIIGANPEDPANAELIRLAQEAHRDARLAGKGDLIVAIVAAASTGDTVAPLEVLSDDAQGW